MKSECEITRSLISRSDGQHRWDSVYRFLLIWAAEITGHKPVSPLKEEEPSDENCLLCTSINSSSAAGSDY
jgi:hypothetical protein